MSSFAQLSRSLKALPRNSLVLFRHGQTQSNITNQLGGWTDSKLTLRGREQAHQLFEALFPNLQSFDNIYSSDLIRAQDTAKISLGFLKNDSIISDKRLREINFGEHENLSYELLDDAQKEIVFSMQYQAPKGESWLDVQQRAKQFIIELKHPGRYLAYTHGGLICTLTYDLGIKDSISNCSCIAFELEYQSIKSLLFHWEFPETTEI